jgi:hypothetical protein
MSVRELATGAMGGALAGLVVSALKENKQLSDIAQSLQSIANYKKKTITIYVENTLNQPITIQILGAPSNPPSSTVPIGSSFTVNPGSADFRTLIPEQTGWTPYITVSLSASTAPTQGAVKVTLIRIDGSTQVIVNNIPITDTTTHNYSTDPNYITVVPW